MYINSNNNNNNNNNKLLQRIDEFLSDIYGNTIYDLKLTKDTINGIIELIQYTLKYNTEDKELAKFATILQALISREKSLYDYFNNKRKLLLDFMEKMEKLGLTKEQADSFFEKYKRIDIYIDEEKSLDIKEFMKERVPSIFTQQIENEGNSLTD